MKIDMKEDMGNKMALRCWFWDRARAAQVFAGKARQDAQICSLWRLEVKDCNENRYEGGH